MHTRYCNFVPISLYVTVEYVNQKLSSFIDYDAKMYDHETNTPAKTRTANLCTLARACRPKQSSWLPRRILEQPTSGNPL